VSNKGIWANTEASANPAVGGFVTATEDTGKLGLDVNVISGSSRTVGFNAVCEVLDFPIVDSGWTAVPRTTGAQTITFQNNSFVNCRVRHVGSTSTGIIIYPNGNTAEIPIQPNLNLECISDSGNVTLVTIEVG
jgi:hypothetical protein